MSVIQRSPITTPYGYIYVITCDLNGMKYIGQRCWNKPDNFDSYMGSGVRLRNAINKYGISHFHKEIIDWANNHDELNQLEKWYIKHNNAVNSKEYYNIQEGGGSWEKGQLAGNKNPFYGRTHSQESIQKMKDHMPDQTGENNPNYGNKWSDEQKERASQNFTGRCKGENNPNYGNKWSDEQKANMSRKMTGKFVGEKSPMFGTHPSEETLKRMSRAQKKRAQEHPWTKAQRKAASLRNMGENNPNYGNGNKIRGEKNPMYGKVHSEESRAKMRKNHANVSGKNNPNYGAKCSRSRAVVKLSKDMKFLEEYESLNEAENMNDKCYRPSITLACNKHKLYKGFYWLWKSDYIKEE